MTSNHALPPRLRPLLDALCDGTVSGSELQELESLTLAAVPAREQLLKYLELDAALRWEFGAGMEARLPAAITLSGATGYANASILPMGTGKARDTRSITKPIWIKIPSIVLARPVLVSIAAVALVFYGSFLALSWNLWGLREPRNTDVAFTADPTTAATILSENDAVWSRNIPAKAAPRLSIGQKLSLASGTVELELKAGTKLVVEGPADWSVDRHNSVSLRAGKLVARVPEAAIGFSVETPTATVVDLGTEFGVEVSKLGATEVQVLAGKIQLRPATPANNSAARDQQITLVAGEARIIEAGVNGAEPVVRKIAAAPGRFARMSETSGVRRIPVDGAMASSTYPFPLVSVNNLINGSGMRGECHTCRSVDGTMWHTEIGKIKNEYVLFDLGLPSRLRSMKVWNYNDDFDNCFRWRGVKQADIYTSNTGRGTPLDHPEEWTLVADDVQFEPSSGTSEYNTPTQIQLNDVNARFVAIVIDEAQGHDPRVAYSSAPYYGDVVGLSEVQFFGERVKSAPSKSRQ